MRGDPLVLCTHDHEPQHHCHFGQNDRLCQLEDIALVGREQYSRDAEGQITKACDYDPNTENAREESGLVHQQSERDKP